MTRKFHVFFLLYLITTLFFFIYIKYLSTYITSKTKVVYTQYGIKMMILSVVVMHILYMPIIKNLFNIMIHKILIMINYTCTTYIDLYTEL